MSDPKTVRELSFSVEGRLGLLTTLVWWVLGVLGSVVLGIGALWFNISSVATDVAVLKNSVVTIDKKLDALQKSTDVSASDIVQRLEARLEPNKPTSNPTPLPNSPAVSFVTESEAEALRAKLGVPPKTNELSKYGFKVGGEINSGLVKPIPQAITDALPIFKGLRFAVDTNNAIALVAPVADRIVAIV